MITESRLPRRSAALDGPLRLCCFPYAGGAASTFRSWPPFLPPEVELVPVQLPGREDRLGDARFTRLAPLVDAIAIDLDQSLTPPFAFFGHSLGALIAYEVARWLRREGRSGPALLCVSGHRAPHLPRRDRMVHDLPDDEFVAELRRLNGTPEEVLADHEMLELMLPLLRDDFALAETYVHEPGEPLDCPIIAFGGSEDDVVGVVELTAWREHTRRAFRRHVVPGDHFFVQSARDHVLAALSADLSAVLRSEHR